ncbi:MAG: hypothetical protein FJY85_00175 [Deltaproteobacteria bacterium]|nr:hypothetical protein [Deltaproteobacteria bacterium]
MNQRTDPIEIPRANEAPEFADGFLWKLELITILALLAILIVGGYFSRDIFMYFRLIGFPWLHASQLTISAPYSDTHSVSLPSLGIGKQMFLLAELLVSFVICPTVFLFGWHRRRVNRERSQNVRSLSLDSVAYGFCGIVTVALAISVGPAAFLQGRSTTSRCEGDASRIQREGMMTEMSLIGVDAFIYQLRPKELGGGDGSFAGYGIGEKLSRTDYGEYTATVKSDKTLEVKGNSARCATNTISVLVDTYGGTYGWRFEGNWLGYG